MSQSIDMKAAIVICGKMGSGKSTVAAFLASKLSVQVVSFGKYIRHIAKRSGRPTTRSFLQELGDSLYQKKGASGLLQGALEVAGIDQGETVVIDGVRHAEVLAEIRRRAGKSIAVYLDADQKERYQRRRSQAADALSPEEFQVLECHAVEAEISDLGRLCDFVIDASQPLAHLLENLPTELFMID